MIFEFGKSVVELDTCVAAVAKRHVVRGATAAERYAIPHFVRNAILRFDPYASRVLSEYQVLRGRTRENPG